MFDEEEKTGTTIMAIKYRDGVLLGADSRTSLATYIPSRVTNKLRPLTEKIFVCTSGSAADTQIICSYVRQSLKLYSELEEGIPKVRSAAMLAKSIIYDYPSLLAGLIVAGYDTGPRIFSISLGGTIVETDWSIGGSGSAFIYGYCDMSWKEDMILEEAIEFVKRAVTCAIHRDNASGGVIRMASITADGVQRYFYPGNKVLQ
jgi:20S proteasome subunit beta 1